MPREGKTSTTISLARRAAFLGDKVLLIEGDFRHPQATRKLRMHQSPGIAEVLSGDAELSDALQCDEASGVKFLSSGNSDEDPVALIGAKKFRAVLEQLEAGFDLIIFDSSPILAVTEPEILSRSVDQTLILIRWGETPREAAQAAVKQLLDFGGYVAGVALTQVNLKRQSYYGYGEYGYYSGRMKNYYAK